MSAIRLGDAGVDNTDISYTGDVSTSPISLDYYRTKAREFQSVLNALDSSYTDAAVLYELTDDESLRSQLDAALSEFESKKWSLKATAEAINGGAELINSLGGRFPVLSIPQTLGFPLALPVAVVAAIATAATLCIWGRDWIDRLATIYENAPLTDPNVSDADKARLADVLTKTRTAQAQSSATGFATIAPVLKWVGIALVAYLGYRAVSPMLKGIGKAD